MIDGRGTTPKSQTSKVGTSWPVAGAGNTPGPDQDQRRRAHADQPVTTVTAIPHRTHHETLLMLAHSVPLTFPPVLQVSEILRLRQDGGDVLERPFVSKQ